MSAAPNSRPRRARWLALTTVTLAISLIGWHSVRRIDWSQSAAPREWRPLQDGLQYSTFKHKGAVFHALRLDLNLVSLRIADARTPSRASADVQTLVAESKALAGVNGTFFGEAWQPIGWLVSEGKQLNTLHETSWWSSLVVRNVEGKPAAEILLTEAVKATPAATRSQVRFAIQVGPRTVSDGAPLKMKNQTAERTAACIVSPQDLILLATEGEVESNVLAALMASAQDKGGLGCRQGMMFDGGPSTQMAIRTSALNFDIHGGWGVPNAVVVVPRAK